MTFEGCEALFDNPIYVIEDTKADYGEQRLCDPWTQEIGANPPKPP